VGALTFGALNDLSQIKRYGQGFEWTDISSSRIARRDEPESRFGRCANDAQHLTEALARAPLAPAPTKHQPMNPYVMKSGGLSQYVGAFKVDKSQRSIATFFSDGRRLNFCVNERANLFRE
jgi:hypothetical protein